MRHEDARDIVDIAQRNDQPRASTRLGALPEGEGTITAREPELVS